MELCHLEGLLHATGPSSSHMAQAVYHSLLLIGMTWTFATASKIADCTTPHMPARALKGTKHFCKSFLREFRLTQMVIQLSIPRGC